LKKRESLSGKNIILGVTGSISAFKSAELSSQLVQRGAEVTVVMTSGATKFVGPLTFQAITRNRVLIDQYDVESVTDATHISETENADLVIIAPATANFIGKVANGIADDLLTSLMLAIRCPVLIAPAMNNRMWENPLVQENSKKLETILGYQMVPPGEGFLACGTYAVGRLAEPMQIVQEIEQCICS
jgi:phosphopantothenoylcysteine decarboxylase/phosphopantothenate--cysteine ligase|tara:strand:+ start:491 stop:1054 length:564 start_codon:yes stop_codon:yes gene_type:complete